MDYHEVVKKLIGPINPVGKSETDRLRLRNLEEMCHLARMLMYDISDVAMNKTRYENSMKTMGEYADQEIKSIIDELKTP